MIKVTVTNTTQANEIIEAFNGEDYDVEIVVKENTTTENSDVRKVLITTNKKRQHQSIKVILTNVFSIIAIIISIITLFIKS